MSGHPLPSAIVLAAGYSRRMVQFKPLLNLGGLRVIDRIISLYRNIGIKDIRVVTGFRSPEICSAMATQPVRVVHNPDYAAGMFASVLAGVNSLPDANPSFFVHPVDIPLVRPHTVAALLEAGHAQPSTVIYPVFDNHRGHPPLIGGNLKSAIRAHNGSGGLRALLDRFNGEALDVPVADEGVLLDMDTPDDYEHLLNRSANSSILTDNECRMLMEGVCRLPAPIIDHCRQVACVAEKLAGAANAGGGSIDIPLMRCAARIHDVARLEKNHAAAGARLLNNMGFSALAAIVAVHMDMDVDGNAALDEAQVVHLADKLVAGDTVVNLSQRFEAKLKKYAHHSIVEKKIEQRRQTAEMIQAKVEQAAGATIDQILTAS